MTIHIFTQKPFDCIASCLTVNELTSLRQTSTTMRNQVDLHMQQKHAKKLFFEKFFKLPENYFGILENWPGDFFVSFYKVHSSFDQTAKEKWPIVAQIRKTSLKIRNLEERMRETNQEHIQEALQIQIAEEKAFLAALNQTVDQADKNLEEMQFSMRCLRGSLFEGMFYSAFGGEGHFLNLPVLQANHLDAESIEAGNLTAPVMRGVDARGRVFVCILGKENGFFHGITFFQGKKNLFEKMSETILSGVPKFQALRLPLCARGVCEKVGGYSGDFLNFIQLMTKGKAIGRPWPMLNGVSDPVPLELCVLESD